MINFLCPKPDSPSGGIKELTRMLYSSTMSLSNRCENYVAP